MDGVLLMTDDDLTSTNEGGVAAFHFLGSPEYWVIVFLLT